MTTRLIGSSSLAFREEDGTKNSKRATNKAIVRINSLLLPFLNPILQRYLFSSSDGVRCPRCKGGVILELKGKGESLVRLDKGLRIRYAGRAPYLQLFPADKNEPRAHMVTQGRLGGSFPQFISMNETSQSHFPYGVGSRKFSLDTSKSWEIKEHPIKHKGEPPLKKRRLGRTNLEVTQIGFGGIPIDKKSRRESEQTVQRAIDLGINFFDTARAYGTSEEKIGSVLGKGPFTGHLASKTYQRDRSGALSDIERSLKNLQVKKIDLYQIHQVDDEETLKRIMGPRGALGGLKEAKRAGRIDWIGVSGHRPDVLCKAIETEEFDTVQAPVNIVDHFIFDTEKILLPLARKLDLGIIAMKPLAGGILKDTSRALRFALAQEVDVVIPGMGNPSEVQEAVSVGTNYRPLSSLELAGLSLEAKDLGTEFCRQCEYCLPCPSGIDIPSVFRLEGYYDRYDSTEWARQQYRPLTTKIAECQQCGECESRCPYQLPIPQKLKKAERKLLGG